MKKQVGFILAGILMAAPLMAEEVKVTAYYPAPYGEYKEVQSTQGTGLATQSGNVGIGKTAASATQKLDVQGNVKFSGALMPGGSAGTSGQVLTSQGSSAAPIWAASGMDYGKISKTNWQNIPTNAETPVTFARLDFGSGISRSGNRLLINKTGTYVLNADVAAYLVGTAAAYGNKFYFLGLYRYVSGNPTGILLAARLDATPPVVAPGSTTDGWMYFTVSEVVRLNAGDEVGMSMTHMVPTNASTSLNLVGYIGPYYNEENSVSLAAYQIA